MPDISMCQNEECPLRESCYRYLATPFIPRQAYADFKPNDKGECSYYWPVKKINADKKEITPSGK